MYLIRMFNINDERIFRVSIMILIIMDLIIFFSTIRKGNKRREDRGTMWLILLGYCTSIQISLISIGDWMNSIIRNIEFPYWIFYVGIVFIWIGIFIRITSVLTLKKAFSVSVQTNKDQSLIKTGLYKYIRNPAYTGSIVSLLGVALASRSVVVSITVLFICIICYGVRIRVEEKALKERFKNEFDEYVKDTCKVFPYIW